MRPEDGTSTGPLEAGEGDHLERGGFSDQEKNENSFPEMRERWFSNPGHRRVVFCVVILIVLMFLLPSAYHIVKGWRAADFIAKSSFAFATGDFSGGLSLLRQAEALSPGSPAVGWAIELYNARAGDTRSLQFLLTQMRSGTLQSGELLGIAEIEAGAGRQHEASEALSRIKNSLNRQELLRKALVESVLLADQGNIFQAAAHCFSTAGALGKDESGFLRVQGARYLLALQEESATRRASDILRSVVREHSPASLLAWRIEANRMLSSPAQNADAPTDQEIQELAKLLPLLPQNLIQDQLLAAEMEIRADPVRKEQILANLTNRYKESDSPVMLQVARWLNSKGYYAGTIAFAGDERPRSDTDWLLVVLDAKSARGEWSEVSALLDSPASSGIPDAVRYLYLARCAMMNGDQAAADDAWSSVTASLHLEKPETLAYIAGYEERIGETQRAARTYREMADREETRPAGLTALIRIQPPTTSASIMIPLYEELLSVAPGFSDAAGDLDYLRLLVGENVPQSAAEAEKLLKAQPNSLARISTAVLGRLRRDDAKGALALYEGKSIDWTEAPLPWLVVRSAALRAAGDLVGAERIACSIDPSKLRPEEVPLLKGTAISTRNKESLP